MKPKQPVQRIGYFPEQPARPKEQAEPLRRRVKKPQSMPDSSGQAQPSRQTRSRVVRAQQTRGGYQQSVAGNDHPPVNVTGVSQQPQTRDIPQPPAKKAPRVSSRHTARETHPSRQAQPMSGGYQMQPEPKKAKALSSAAIQRLIMAGCIVVFAVSAFLLVRYFVNIAITRKASSQLGEVYSAALQNTQPPEQKPEPTATPAPTATLAAAPKATPAKAAVPVPTAASASELWPNRYPNNPSLRVSSVFYELQRENPDIIGWLKIDGVLEEAVVQRDNEYYLTHNALRQKSVTGALFLDENCDLKTVPTQMLIHGHNMKEGAMFGSLKKYKVKDASFYRQHPFIEFNTMYENGKYVIFAVAEVDLRWNKGDYLPFWQDVRFFSADAFMSYVQKARNLSHYRCNVDVEPGDRLLTLSTCTGTDDNKRLIVMARKLRDHENELELNMSIMSTYDR